MAIHGVAVLAYVNRWGGKYEVRQTEAREALEQGETVHALSVRHDLTTGSIAPCQGNEYMVSVINGPHGGGRCQRFDSAWLMLCACLDQGPRGR